MADSEREERGQRGSGGIVSLGERLRNIEKSIKEHNEDDEKELKAIWEKLNAMDKDIAKSNTKLGIALTVAFFVLSAVLQVAMKVAFK